MVRGPDSGGPRVNSAATERGARERILAAAVERIARDGIDEVRIARIAMAAGVSTSLVHYHFETREALLEQALEYSYELAGDVRLGPEGDAVELGSDRRLAAMIDQFLPYPGMLERDWILWVELWLRAVRHAVAHGPHEHCVDRGQVAARRRDERVGRGVVVARPGRVLVREEGLAQPLLE